MLCSSCYKKIPEGEEVAKTTGYWKTNGWGREGNEIFCKKCAIKQDRKDRFYFYLFFIAPFLFMFIFWIIFLIVKFVNK